MGMLGGMVLRFWRWLGISEGTFMKIVLGLGMNVLQNMGRIIRQRQHCWKCHNILPLRDL